MDEFWDCVENVWNKSRVVAWVLALSGVSLALWASLCPQSPGVSIGLLALAAGIMSVRTKMHPSEKFAWVAVLVVFAILEVRAINKSDETNEAIRNGQNQKFQDIADGLQKSVDTSKKQYDSTITHVEGVLKTTNQVGLLAAKNLENVTGGDAFAYVFPSVISEGNDLVTLNVHNDGAQVLSGVVVTIRRVISGAPEPEATNVGVVMDTSLAIPIGPLAPHEGRTVPGGVIRPILSADGNAVYHIWVNAQNPGTSENLYFRPSKDGQGWAYMLKAWKEATGKRKKGDVFAPREKIWIRYVKTRDWVEPTKRR
jgi:hypothetical protein